MVVPSPQPIHTMPASFQAPVFTDIGWSLLLSLWLYSRSESLSGWLVVGRPRGQRLHACTFSCVLWVSCFLVFSRTPYLQFDISFVRYWIVFQRAFTDFARGHRQSWCRGCEHVGPRLAISCCVTPYGHQSTEGTKKRRSSALNRCGCGFAKEMLHESL